MSEQTDDWKLYICRACGLIYDEKEGDPDSGIAPGTRFEDIPDDWECPLCGVGKGDFELFNRPVVAVNEATFSHNTSGEPGVVIIGAGMAGWAMAEALRQQGSQLPITIITACAGDVYHKPELSIAIGRNKNQQQLVKESGAEAAARLSVTLIPHTYVVSLSTQLKSVRTTRGTFPFQYLVIALGANNQVPADIPAESSWRINHIDSWSGLAQSLAPGPQKIAVVGAGMVGCELAENLAFAGHHVSLIYRDATPLFPLLPSIAGERLQSYLSQQGVDCKAGESVLSVTDKGAMNNGTTNKGEIESEIEGERYQLELASGNSIHAHVIVTATGLKADQRLATIAGIHYDNGVVVDPKTLLTSADDIFALGDCISLFGRPCRFISPIVKQAKTIASQIVGDSFVPYLHQTPNIRLKVQSCTLTLQGSPQADCQWQTTVDDENTLAMEQSVGGEIIAQISLQKAS